MFTRPSLAFLDARDRNVQQNTRLPFHRRLTTGECSTLCLVTLWWINIFIFRFCSSDIDPNLMTFDIWTRTRYSKAILAYQKWSFHVNAFKLQHKQGRQTDRQTQRQMRPSVLPLRYPHSRLVIKQLYDDWTHNIEIFYILSR